MLLELRDKFVREVTRDRNEKEHLCECAMFFSAQKHKCNKIFF